MTQTGCPSVWLSSHGVALRFKKVGKPCCQTIWLYCCTKARTRTTGESAECSKVQLSEGEKERTGNELRQEVGRGRKDKEGKENKYVWSKDRMGSFFFFFKLFLNMFYSFPVWEFRLLSAHTHLLHHDWDSMANSERPREATKAKGHASSMKKNISSSRTGNTVTDIRPICGRRRRSGGREGRVFTRSYALITANTWQPYRLYHPHRKVGRVCLPCGAEGGGGTFHGCLRGGADGCPSSHTEVTRSRLGSTRRSRAGISEKKKKNMQIDQRQFSLWHLNHPMLYVQSLFMRTQREHAANLDSAVCRWGSSPSVEAGVST